MCQLSTRFMKAQSDFFLKEAAAWLAQLAERRSAAVAYFGDMLQGQVSLFDQGELDQAKISRKRFYICFSLLTP